MNHFVYWCEDIEDNERATQIRREQLVAHLHYVERNVERYAVAGPNRHGDGAYHSSTFIIAAASLEEADALMTADPYVAAGLYREVRGMEFVPAAGQWIGGITW